MPRSVARRKTSDFFKCSFLAASPAFLSMETGMRREIVFSFVLGDELAMSRSVGKMPTWARKK